MKIESSTRLQPRVINTNDYVKVADEIKGDTFEFVNKLKPTIAKYACKNNMRVFVREIESSNKGPKVRMMLSNLTNDGKDSTPLLLKCKAFEAVSKKSIQRQFFEFLIESVQELKYKNLTEIIKPMI